MEHYLVKYPQRERVFGPCALSNKTPHTISIFFGVEYVAMF